MRGHLAQQSPPHGRASYLPASRIAGSPRPTTTPQTIHVRRKYQSARSNAASARPRISGQARRHERRSRQCRMRYSARIEAGRHVAAASRNRLHASSAARRRRNHERHEEPQDVSSREPFDTTLKEPRGLAARIRPPVAKGATTPEALIASARWSAPEILSGGPFLRAHQSAIEVLTKTSEQSPPARLYTREEVRLRRVGPCEQVTRLARWRGEQLRRRARSFRRSRFKIPRAARIIEKREQIAGHSEITPARA